MGLLTIIGTAATIIGGVCTVIGGIVKGKKDDANVEVIATKVAEKIAGKK